MFREAGELLPHLPQAEGEATHALMTGRVDLAVQLAAILDHYATVCGGMCRSLTLATLSFNRRNTTELAELLQTGKVGTLTLLCSLFFKQHNREEYADARRQSAEFPGRWRIAAARCHAKVACADFSKVTIVVEASANLRTNGNVEQVTVYRDAGLYAWHAAWIHEMVTRHEQDD